MINQILLDKDTPSISARCKLIILPTHELHVEQADSKLANNSPGVICDNASQLPIYIKLSRLFLTPNLKRWLKKKSGIQKRICRTFCTLNEAMATDCHIQYEAIATDCHTQYEPMATYCHTQYEAMDTDSSHQI